MCMCVNPATTVSAPEQQTLCMRAHTGIVELHNGIIRAHTGIVELHNGIIRAHTGIVGLHNGIIRAHTGNSLNDSRNSSDAAP